MIFNTVKLNKELATLRTDKLEWVKSMESHKTEKEKLEQTIEELTAKLSKLEEAHKALEEKDKNAKKEEAAVVIAVEESVNKKVVQQLATLGVQEGLVKEEIQVPVEASADTSEIYKKYESLSGKDKVEFFKKNEKAVLKGMRAFHYQTPVTPSNLRKF